MKIYAAKLQNIMRKTALASKVLPILNVYNHKYRICGCKTNCLCYGLNVFSNNTLHTRYAVCAFLVKRLLKNIKSHALLKKKLCFLTNFVWL